MRIQWEKRLLSRQDVESVLTMQDAIDAVEEAFRQHHLGTAQLPLRTPTRAPEPTEELGADRGARTDQNTQA